jgi:hypothetical protein
MDTFKDKIILDDLWTQGRAPWRVWDRDPIRNGNGHVAGGRPLVAVSK